MLNTVQRGRLRDLKQMLIDTDFKIIKCYEAQMLGEPLPYDFQALVADRKMWRQEINELKELQQ
jgi:hypothetical protein